MNARRINDVLKLVGAFIAAAAAFTPFLPPEYIGTFTKALASLTTLVGVIGAYLAGLGTRAAGTEYQDVADAKARASMMPPPVQ